MYDLRAPNPLSESASSSDIYLARGQFVGNYYVDSSCFLGVGFDPHYQLLFDSTGLEKSARQQ
jgi:hypothetical protein